ncbi:hypothetical protein [Pelagibacterium lacus]|uniref:hypothetical protein n=1 Tax=Pelagibacterium lacus TaxID=2282655 RepID=UPI001314E073|nr:hypothetical protein [Pelagibacterium lacus]
MAESKTRPTGESVAAFIEAIADETKRRDAHILAEMMERVTGVNGGVKVGHWAAQNQAT